MTVLLILARLLLLLTQLCFCTISLNNSTHGQHGGSADRIHCLSVRRLLDQILDLSGESLHVLPVHAFV